MIIPKKKNNLKFLKKKDYQAVEELIHKLQEFLGTNLKQLLLFGSKVKGTDTPESDIDIVVLVQQLNPKIKDSILNLIFNIDLKYDVYISPRILSVSTFENRLWQVTPFIQRVKKEGIPL